MSQSLPADLDNLVFRGTLARADDGEAWAMTLEVAEMLARNELTEPQARALCQMLGFPIATIERPERAA